MTTAKSKPVPDGAPAFIPHLVCANASAAIDFYKKAFGAIEEMRLAGPDGKLMHASLLIGGARLMLVDEMPEWGVLGAKTLKGSPVSIHRYVEDVDAAYAKAVAAGAKATMPVADQFWGDRYGTLEDPFGHRWSLATHLRDVGPEELKEALAQMAASAPNCPT
jgi:uncharacterized glyoxalase superfamily protein PhnB